MAECKYKERFEGIDYYYCLSIPEECTSETCFAEAQDLAGGVAIIFLAPVARSTPGWTEKREETILQLATQRTKQLAMDDGSNYRLVYWTPQGKRMVKVIRWDNKKRGKEYRDE